MKIRFDAERVLAAFAAGASLVVAITCSGRAELGRTAESAHHPEQPAGASLGAPNAPHAGSADSPRALHDSRAAQPDAKKPASALPITAPRLFEALAALERGRRTDHVRIVWFGDSHTAADFITQALREKMARFESGGPGHVLLGMKPYRHGMVKSELFGGFRIEPSPPALAQRHDDGVFGLAGVRSVPDSGEAGVLLTPQPRTVRGRARWEIVYRLPPGASFRLRLGNAEAPVDERTRGKPRKPGMLPRIVREAAPSDALQISGAKGSPQLFGAILEGTEPGLVIDTLGINGARAATALAWDEQSFVAEVAARAPEAYVIAYGTNEAFDTRPAERAVQPLPGLVARLRRAAPRADCVILGPPDAADASGGSLPKIAQIETAQRRVAGELGCSFFSLREVMGGDGSFERWAKEKPPLARSDRVHLTPAGYAKLGEALAHALLESYAAGAGQPRK